MNNYLVDFSTDFTTDAATTGVENCFQHTHNPPPHNETSGNLSAKAHRPMVEISQSRIRPMENTSPDVAAAKTETSEFSNSNASDSASTLYNAMNGGMWGLGTDEEQLFATLQDKSLAEMNQIREHYKNHYGRELDVDLKNELSGLALKKVEAILNQDSATTAAVTLLTAMKGGTGVGTDNEAIFNTLKDKSPDEIKRIDAAYQNISGGQSLSNAFSNELSGAYLHHAQALLTQDTATIDAAKIYYAMKGGSGIGTDRQTLEDTLQGKSLEEIREIEEAYKKISAGSSLSDDLNSELSGHAKQQIGALLRGDTIEATVIKLHEAMKGGTGIGTNDQAIYAAFEGASDEVRQKIVSLYNEKYHSGAASGLDSDLQFELGAAALDKARTLVQSGKLTDAEKLEFAMRGIGTDEDAIKDILKNKSAEEIKLIQENYHGNLEADLNAELGGKDKFSARLALRGEPVNIEESVARLNEMHKFERSGLGAWLMDKVSSQGALYDQTVRQTNEALKAAQQDGEVTEEEQAKLKSFVAYGKQDDTAYTDAEATVADTTATIAATAAGTAVVLASGGLALPVVAGAAAVGGAGYVATKSAIQGEGYDWQNGAADFAIGAVEGGGAAVFSAAASSLSKGSGLIAKPNGQLRQLILESSLDGTLGGGSGGFTRTAADADTWNNGLQSALGAISAATGQDALAGLVGGGVFAGGINKASRGIEVGLAQGVEIAKKVTPSATEVVRDIKQSISDKLTASGLTPLQPAFAGLPQAPLVVPKPIQSSEDLIAMSAGRPKRNPEFTPPPAVDRNTFTLAGQGPNHPHWDAAASWVDHPDLIDAIDLPDPTPGLPGFIGRTCEKNWGMFTGAKVAKAGGHLDKVGVDLGFLPGELPNGYLYAQVKSSGNNVGDHLLINLDKINTQYIIHGSLEKFHEGGGFKPIIVGNPPEGNAMRIWDKEIFPALKNHGIYISRNLGMSPLRKAELRNFAENVRNAYEQGADAVEKLCEKYKYEIESAYKARDQKRRANSEY